MNLKIPISKAWISLCFALSRLTVLFGSSCQKNSITNSTDWYYTNQSILPSSASVSGNKVNFISGKLVGIPNNYFIGPGNPTPAGWSTNVWGASINASMFLSPTIINYK